MMLALAMFTDPKSGEIRPTVAWLLLTGLPVAIATVFYAEYKSRGKRWLGKSQQTNHRNQIKQQNQYKKNSASSEC
jgi:hypothetical protein